LTVTDGDYVVQGLWSGRIVTEFSLDDEAEARREALALLRSPTFEGDSVRVITRDGDPVWHSESSEEQS